MGKGTLDLTGERLGRGPVVPGRERRCRSSTNDRVGITTKQGKKIRGEGCRARVLRRLGSPSGVDGGDPNRSGRIVELFGN